MTRHERQQLFAIIVGLRLGHVDRCMHLLRDMLVVADAEHATEDMVNAALERASKGTGDDHRPV